MRKVNIGMISFAHGHAYAYLRALQSLADVAVVAIAEENAERAERMTREFGPIACYEDYNELLASEVDAVVVCSENARHAEHVIAAARSGKHVLCEKPLGVQAEEMERMIAACRENGVQLMTAFPCRYAPPIAAAKAAVARGDIGEVLAVKGWNRGTMPGHWFIDPSLSGGGAIMDHTVHVVDLMHWIIGGEVVEVFAEAGRLFHPITVEDAGLVHVRFADGTAGVVDTSWSRTRSAPMGWDVVLEVIGSQGVLTVDGFGQMNPLYSDLRTKAQWSYWGDSMELLMVRDFVDAVREGRSVAVDGMDGYRATAVALAAYESVRQGMPVAPAVIAAGKG